MKDSNSFKKNYASSREILELLENGALIIVLLSQPLGGALLLKHLTFKLLDKIWGKYNQARLRQSIKRMVDRKLLEIKKEGEETEITVTEKGKKLLLRYNFQRMQLEKPKVWDKKWRVVIFDINEGKKVMRDSLRNKIKSLGFYPLQKSVFVTPYPCEKEVAFLRQYFGIGDEVSYFIATNLEEESFLKKEFKLD